MMETEMEMKIKRIDRGQKDATNILNSDGLEIISVPEEAQNVNSKDKDNKDENLDIDISSVFLFDADRRYTKEDLKYNFLALKWAAWLKVSPFGVDENSKSFPGFRSSHKKWWQNGISYGWFFLTSIRTLIVILSGVHFGMTHNTDEKLGEMSMMILCFINGVLLLYSLLSYRLGAQNIAPFLLSIFKYLDADAEAAIDLPETRPRKSGFGGHTLKELLIILFPCSVYSLAGTVPLLIAADPSFPFLLVSLVEPGFSFSFLSLTAFDSVLFVYYYMIIHTFFYIFLGMHRIQEEAGLTLKNLTTKITSETTPTPTEKEKEESIKIQKALKSLGLLHIWTHFFNTSFSDVMYAIKLLCLTTSILGGFGLIKMIEVANWPYTGVFSLLLFQGIFVYNLTCGRAFEIPEKVEDIKREIRKQSFKTYKNNPFERKYVEKYLRSIPWLGVKDGVYKMERLTCVNYTSFAVQQISSLVLTY